MKEITAAALLGIASVLLIAQFTRIQRTNPPLKGDLAAPLQIKALLRRACYDCHSNETRWPWYAHIAPVSWLIRRDVERGRKELNFSEWGSYYPKTQSRKLQWIGRALRAETMPPWIYRILHPGVGLTQEDLVMLEHWLESEIANQPETQSENQENSK